MAVWDGEFMVPLHRFRALCDRQFVVGEEYALELVSNRSLASHNHFFACVAEAFNNLSEEDAKRFPTAEHLRKWALCRTGFATETSYVMDTPVDARKMAAAIRRADEFCVIVVKENVVQVFNAESQSMPAMNKERFQASKNAVLDLLASMARTTTAQLKKEAAINAPPRRKKEE